MSLIRKTIKAILYLVLAVVLLFGGLLAYSTFTDYKPPVSETLAIDGKGQTIQEAIACHSFWKKP